MVTENLISSFSVAHVNGILALTRKPGWAESLSKSSVGVGEISLIVERVHIEQKQKIKTWDTFIKGSPSTAHRIRVNL